ncbi:MAG: DUF4369 domain-containing protein [Breznakibacter sp.]
MKKVVSILGLLLPMTLLAQEGEFFISGKVGAFNAPAKVYLLSQRGQAIDSAVMKNGAFELKGKVDNSRQSILLLDRQGIGARSALRSPGADYCEFYLEQGKISVAGKDSMVSAVVTGSALNADFQAYRKSAASALAAEKAVYAEYQQASKEKKESPEFREEIDRKYDAASNDVNKAQAVFIQAHPNSKVSLDLLKSMSGIEMDLSVVEPLFNGLSEAVRNSADGQAFASEMEKGKKLGIGAVAPDFPNLIPPDRR